MCSGQFGWFIVRVSSRRSEVVESERVVVLCAVVTAGRERIPVGKAHAYPLSLVIERTAEQHAAGCEKAFWLAHGKSIHEVKQLAKSLYAFTGDRDKAIQLIEAWK